MTFAALGLPEPLMRALDGAGYVTPTPIQARAIPHLLEDFDLLGIAQTGTGKTAAFTLPILSHLIEDPVRLPAKGVRALILAPTRELAIQIGETIAQLARHTRIRHTVIFGGVGQSPQVRALAQGMDIVVATPGRLLDLLQQRCVRLDTVTHLVLDEADRMLDMGFVRDVMKIVAHVPKERQTLLFSATMPAAVTKLVAELLFEPVRVEVTPEVVTVEAIEQHLLHIATPLKRAALLKLLEDPALARVIVFTRTKHGANRVSEHLEKAGIGSGALHGNKSQTARQKTLAEFKAGKVRVLVATDIAARGIDVSDVSHVVNFDLPDEPESYVHRIGRTGRAGRSGAAFAFCDSSERGNLRDIERLIKRTIPVMTMEGLPTITEARAAEPREERRPPRQEQRRRPQNGRNRQPRRAA